MRTVWRLCGARHSSTAMGGEGARLYGGRWNAKGTPLVYCSSTLSLAVLEVLVHAASLPANFVAIQIDIPDEVTIDAWPLSSLPSGWQAMPAPVQLARMGTRWAHGLGAVALEVPSAIVEVETNVLINPAHPEASRLVVHSARAFPFDPRLA